MTFLEQILSSLARIGDAVVLQEVGTERTASFTARQLLAQVQVARAYLRRLRLKKGDRCALLANNSIRWVAMDLAIMAEGLTAVPLYARQAPSELVAMMKDCWPAVIACGEKALGEAIVQEWPEAPPYFCFDNVFVAGRRVVPNYTLYPEAKFPRFMQDAAQSVAWTRAHAREWGGDPDQLYLVGHSAGAHIAVLLALDQEYLQQVGGSQRWLRGVVGLAGPYDFLPFTEAYLNDLFGPAADFARSQPINFVRADAPPMLPRRRAVES